MSMAVTACQSDEPPQQNPYDDYTYYGRSGDQGEAGSHFASGVLQWYLISRMFNGYGYYPPTYYNHYYHNFRRDDGNPISGYHGGGAVGRVYTGTTDALGGAVSAMHGVTGRGGFGATGYGRGGGGLG